MSNHAGMADKLSCRSFRNGCKLFIHTANPVVFELGWICCILESFDCLFGDSLCNYRMRFERMSKLHGCGGKCRGCPKVGLRVFGTWGGFLKAADNGGNWRGDETF